MRYLCRDCAHYCPSCRICSVDKEYHNINDSCRDFAPEGGIEEVGEESEVSE